MSPPSSGVELASQLVCRKPWRKTRKTYEEIMNKMIVAGEA